MFPHNSSSHEISTETNAFVQNSKGDVVVLEGSSLSGVGEGNGPEDAGYCDIEFINSSTMAAPTSHPEATAANDFSTVLSRHSGELGSAGMRSSRRSPSAPAASAATMSATPTAAAGDGEAVEAEDDEGDEDGEASTAAPSDSSETRSSAAIHNKVDRQSVVASSSSALPASQAAANSKSTSKPLSDNKDSFSSVSPRVLSLRSGGVRSSGSGTSSSSSSSSSSSKDRNKMNWSPRGPTPSLVRIPKSDGQRALNLKAKLSHVSYFKPNNSKSVIKSPLGCASGRVGAPHDDDDDDDDYEEEEEEEDVRDDLAEGVDRPAARTASSSITLIVSKQRPSEPEAATSASCVPLARARAPGSRRAPGISRTEATMCTVGALSFQDNNNKSNEPLNASFKDVAPTAADLTLKSLSKSTPSVKSSDKSDQDVDEEEKMIDGVAMPVGGEGDAELASGGEEDAQGEGETRPSVNIPTATTCEPTMTLKRRASGVTEGTPNVPAELSLERGLRQRPDDLEVENNEVSSTNNNPESNSENTKTRARLVEDCKALIGAYWTTRDERTLTRLREALNTLLTSGRCTTATNSSASSTLTLPKTTRMTYDTTIYEAASPAGYRERWGIPALLCLAGGGESSLNNSAAANWGTAQPTTPNNNNQAQSGWNGTGGGGGGGVGGSGTPGNQAAQAGQAGQPNNWQSVGGPRNVGGQIGAQNANQNHVPGLF